MRSSPGARLKTWVASSTGLALVFALVGLTVLHRVLPRFERGVFDYGAAANDPMVWTQLYVGLLALGFVPALLALCFAVEGVVDGHGRDAWLAVALNGVFLLTAARLAWILGRQGFFGFVMVAMQAFIEV